MEKNIKKKSREMNSFEKAQLSLSFISPIMVFIIFIISFIAIVKFDKNSFYPSYNMIKEHHSLFVKLDLKYNDKEKNEELINKLNVNYETIKKNADYYNQNIGFLKNKNMIELSNIYHDYEIKIQEINRNTRHEKYLSKVEYADVMELLPTNEEMEKINSSLPKSFFITFIESLFIAVILQFFIYNITLILVKIIIKKND